MKILIITPYVTLKGRFEFERNKTGFGYMVMDIAKAVGKMEKVEVLATDTRGDGFQYEGLRFLKRSLTAYILNIIYCLSIGTVISLRKNYSMSNGTFIRLVYYWMMTGYLVRLLQKEKYDVVHIHGCNYAMELWMRVCKKCDQKYVVTLHGLTSFSDTVRIDEAGRKHERDFLRRVADGEPTITVISSGMKKIIENTYKKKSCPSIHVVCNSFTFEKSEARKVDIREIYNLPDDSKIILYVGNVCPRKNQGQFINAFNLLTPQQAQNYYVLFLGSNIAEDYNIEMFSDETRYKEHCISCGIVDKELVSQYYEQSNAVALMSLSEGFGLSLIEGMHFGLPCMSFADMDAFVDIYDECAMVGVTNHSDEAIAKAIELLLTNKWDREKIKNYSKKFESSAMAQNYLNVYDVVKAL